MNNDFFESVFKRDWTEANFRFGIDLAGLEPEPDYLSSTASRLSLHPVYPRINVYGKQTVCCLVFSPLNPPSHFIRFFFHRSSCHRLVLASKATSIVLAKIQGDVSKHPQKTPQAIPLRLRGFSSITGIEMVFSPPSHIDLTLLSRYDSTSEYRNLYHARQLAPMKEIYVKFTQRYSVKVHQFCAKKGLARNCLGLNSYLEDGLRWRWRRFRWGRDIFGVLLPTWQLET